MRVGHQRHAHRTLEASHVRDNAPDLTADLARRCDQWSDVHPREPRHVLHRRHVRRIIHRDVEDLLALFAEAKVNGDERVLLGNFNRHERQQFVGEVDVFERDPRDAELVREIWLN